MNLVGDCVSATVLRGTRLVNFETLTDWRATPHASLFCESEPPLMAAHMPPPKSSVARLSPSIILVNSKLRVHIEAVWPRL